MGPTTPARTLDAAPRLVLATVRLGPPALVTLPFWWDTEHLWTTAAVDDVDVAGMAAGAAAFVPAPDGSGDGVAFTGDVRVYGLADPVPLVAHGLVVSAAMAALALKNPAAWRALARQVLREPGRALPPQRVVLRLAVEAPRVLSAPALGPGIAPALPPVVPAAVRRLAGGQRRVLLAVRDGAGPAVLAPAVWGAGFTLAVADGVEVPDGAPAAVLVEEDPSSPTAAAGLVVTGDVQGRRLVTQRAAWWQGMERGSAAIPPAPTLVLPE